MYSVRADGSYFCLVHLLKIDAEGKVYRNVFRFVKV